jgi:hypothetical protein
MFANLLARPPLRRPPVMSTRRFYLKKTLQRRAPKGLPAPAACPVCSLQKRVERLERGGR